MASLPSGSGNEQDDTELVVIETKDFHLYIKGKPYHERYKGMRAYKMIQTDEKMDFTYTGEDIESVSVFDLEKGELSPHTAVPPIFFENRIYQLVIMSKSNKNLTFYHEHPGLRRAVSTVGKYPNQLLMGNLHFQNEIGFSTFEVHDEDNTKLLTVTLEIFPVKLNYKDDYDKLLKEVNDEVYNLAFHFVKKTYLGATNTFSTNPSWAEFYRIFNKHFAELVKSINLIERQPHHQLKNNYKKVRGDQLRKVDSTGRKYLKKNPQLFKEVPNGINVNGKSIMPINGLNVKKEVSYNTLENRFVKWMMKRLVFKLEGLIKAMNIPTHPYFKQKNESFIVEINKMKNMLATKIKSPFWEQIGQLDRSVISVVMQMAPGYRETYKIFLTVSRGLLLHGQFYNMSVKDVATLYEYWTFIKLGKILGSKYPTISQDIVKVRNDGLFVTLDQSASAKRVFKHPVTDEKITLHFQKLDRNLPTVSQKPDSMLSIEKKGKGYHYHYIFDAKYRIDFATKGTDYGKRYKQPGPLEEDINTMHRYRDALVVKEGGPFERYAFGAYVLFPWFNEDDYEDHHFYKSINDVNIGAFPFLPNSTRLVDQFITRLIEKSPEELQDEGILPKGAKQDWLEGIEEKVLIGKVESENSYKHFLESNKYVIPLEYLRDGWHEVKHVGLYLPKKGFDKDAGVSVIGTIDNVRIVKGREPEYSNALIDYAVFEIKVWKSLDKRISPVNYGIQQYMITTLSNIKEASELPELFMKSTEEMKLWKILRRISTGTRMSLDHESVDLARKIDYYQLGGIEIRLIKGKNILEIKSDQMQSELPLDLLKKNPSRVFREIVEYI